MLRLTPVLLLLLAAPAAAGDFPDLQSEARDAIRPVRTLDLTHLALDLVVDVTGRSVEGTARWAGTPIGPGADHLVLDQIGLTIEGVTVDGDEATWRQTEDKLHIGFPPADGPVEIVVAYRAEPTNGLHFRGPGPDSPDAYPEVWSQGEDVDHRHWFPTWDDPSDRFTFAGRFTVEDRFTAVSNGVLVSRSSVEGRRGWTTWHYELTDQDLVSYLVALAVGPYTKVEHGADGGVPLETYVGPGWSKEDALRVTQHTAEMLDVFADATGVRYPYPVYRQIFVQRFMYGGMENTTATINTDAALHPARMHEGDDNPDGLVSHELAHQWFGDQLTCKTWREMWLNEGFATYFAAVWGEHKLGPEWGAVRAARMYRGVRGADDGTPRPLVRRFYNQTDGEHTANPYAKGSSVLRMLRVMLGDATFDAAMQAYTRRNQHGLVETEDLKRAFEEVSGADLDWFFDQWVYLAGHPKLTVRHAVDDGRVRVSVEQTQDTSGVVPLFTLPLDVEIATTNGVRVERVWMDGDQRVAASWELDGELLYVGFDPRGGLLAEVDHERTSAELLAALESEHPWTVRSALVALREKEGRPSDEERLAMAGLLTDPTQPREWRKAAARALGAWRDDASTDVLLEALAGERDRQRRGLETASHGVRATIVGTLGGGDGSPRDDVVSALKDVAARDPNENLRADAIRALGRLLEERARPVALTALQATTHGQRVEQAGAGVLGQHGLASDLRALAPHRTPDTPRGLLQAAMWASVRIAKREDLGKDRDDARRPIARDAEALLQDRDLRVRQLGRQVLAQVGDDRSVQALAAARRFETDPEMLAPIDDAIESIRKRKDEAPDATEGELEARLKKIEERIDAAEAELKELEERR